MDYETQLKLQAFLDGELPEQEARDVAALVARDSEATDLLTELRNTRKALADFEPRRTRRTVDEDLGDHGCGGRSAVP